MFALQHIQDTALISDNEVLMAHGAARAAGARGMKEGYRIEGYDISNISGTSAVGSMVVFEDGEPNKNEYRKFKIRSIFQPNDVGMLKEVLERRFARTDWPMPDLVLIDGGLAQVNTARRVLLRAGIKFLLSASQKDRNAIAMTSSASCRKACRRRRS
jgi:excinuclease UvrABC nuclease subunit